MYRQVDKALRQYAADRQKGLPEYVPVSRSYVVVTEEPRTAAHQASVTDDGVQYVDEDGNSIQKMSVCMCAYA